LRRIVKEH